MELLYPPKDAGILLSPLIFDLVSEEFVPSIPNWGALCEFSQFGCRYAKVNEPLTCCTIGTKISLPSYEEESLTVSSKDPSAFYGQIGPVYLFNDSIASEHVQGIYSLGPSYMYSFLDNETAVHLDNPLPSGVLDVKDGLASKIIFGLNSQVLPLFSWMAYLKIMFFCMFVFNWASNFCIRHVMEDVYLMFRLWWILE